VGQSECEKTGDAYSEAPFRSSPVLYTGRICRGLGRREGTPGVSPASLYSRLVAPCQAMPPPALPADCLILRPVPPVAPTMGGPLAPPGPFRHPPYWLLPRTPASPRGGVEGRSPYCATTRAVRAAPDLHDGLAGETLKSDDVRRLSVGGCCGVTVCCRRVVISVAFGGPFLALQTRGLGRVLGA